MPSIPATCTGTIELEGLVHEGDRCPVHESTETPEQAEARHAECRAHGEMVEADQDAAERASWDAETDPDVDPRHPDNRTDEERWADDRDLS